MKPANSVLDAFGTTVFELFSQLARDHDTINLGQGFPDAPGPAAVVEEAARALLEEDNQYPPMPGLPALRRAVAEHDRRFYDLEVDWRTEVLVTVGATGALAACLFGLIEPGDEVVLFEPLYDSYLPVVQRAGAVARLVPLPPPDWRLERAALEAAVSPRTKLIVVNTPLNPAGKLFDDAEIAMIAEVASAVDAMIVSDEVYEHLVFDGRRHRPLITWPGLRDRTLKIGSAGKTFSMTGWKVGTVTGDPALIRPVARAHQVLTFTVAPNLQHAVARGLALDDGYFTGLAATHQAKRDRLAAGLAAAGFGVLPCAGTYFLVADLRPTGFDGDDVAFCHALTREAGVTAIPISAFYAGPDPTRHLVRFCFCKADAVLDAAVVRLADWVRDRR